MNNLPPDYTPSIDQFTKRAVRSFWEDGLWDLACAGVFILLGTWGGLYTRFLAFPPSARPFMEAVPREQVAWIGLALLVAALLVYLYLAWFAVKALKRRLVYPYTGLAEHRFFMPVDRQVFLWYFVLYILGLASVYGLYKLVKGGFGVLSVPFIVSPAVICLVIGKIYDLPRYQWTGVAGFVMAVSMELLITTPADYLAGPTNILEVLPQWGNPALPCTLWAVVFAISGLVALLNVRRGVYDRQ